MVKTVCMAISCAVVFVSNGYYPAGSVGGSQLSRGSSHVLANSRPQQTPPKQVGRYSPSKKRLAMYLKKGVSLRGLSPEIIPALVILSDLTGGDYVVTSGTEPAPGRIPTSLHPLGLAIDVRVPTLEDEIGLRTSDTFKSVVSNAFENTEYDLVWYDSHVHIEFDPK